MVYFNTNIEYIGKLCTIVFLPSLKGLRILVWKIMFKTAFSLLCKSIAIGKILAKVVEEGVRLLKAIQEHFLARFPDLVTG